jgi:S-adenosylmethionine decarboxylase
MQFTPGQHLLVDFWKVAGAQDIASIELALKRAIEACGARLLNIQLHSFGETSGVTGVAILAESHISIHTWPEIDYVAIDIFMCGACDPHVALASLAVFFKPLKQTVTEHARGVSCF